MEARSRGTTTRATVRMHRPGIEPGANGPHEAWTNQARLATINFTTKPTVQMEVLIPGFEPGTFRVLSGRYDQLNHTSVASQAGSRTQCFRSPHAGASLRKKRE